MDVKIPTIAKMLNIMVVKLNGFTVLYGLVNLLMKLNPLGERKVLKIGKEKIKAIFSICFANIFCISFIYKASSSLNEERNEVDVFRSTGFVPS